MSVYDIYWARTKVTDCKFNIGNDKKHNFLNELSINGEDLGEDEDEDFDLPEDDEDNYEDASEEGGEDVEGGDEDFDLPEDDETPEDQADQAAAEEGGEDENFDLPEDEGGDNANQAPADDAGAGDAGGDQGGEDENFDMDPNAGGGDAGGEGGGDAAGAEGGGEGAEGGEGQQAEGDAKQQAGDPTDAIKDQEQKESEEKIYNSLTDQQKNLRTLKLKTQFKNVYTQMISTLDSISNIPKTPKNIEIISRIVAKLSEANVMIVDYIAYNFDVTPYIANFVEYLKYLNILRTITKVLNMMVEERNKDTK